MQTKQGRSVETEMRQMTQIYIIGSINSHGRDVTVVTVMKMLLKAEMISELGKQRAGP